MIWLAHESEEHAKESAAVLAGLGFRACKLLADSVVTTGVTRKRLSKAAHDLESAGFLFVRDVGDSWEPVFQLTPSLAGEEALQVLEET
ncbi:hypothetical protein [Duganella sp. LjRoot269]|uniref:hypothetical protein n=1 Tax=Duganella sp. LjRoot269 TaxID=3342305 RepID=UPI003ED053B8